MFRVRTDLLARGLGHTLYPNPQGRRGAGQLGPSPQSCILGTKIIPSEEQVRLEGKRKHSKINQVQISPKVLDRGLKYSSVKPKGV